MLFAVPEGTWDAEMQAIFINLILPFSNKGEIGKTLTTETQRTQRKSLNILKAFLCFLCVSAVKFFYFTQSFYADPACMKVKLSPR